MSNAYRLLIVVVLAVAVAAVLAYKHVNRPSPQTDSGVQAVASSPDVPTTSAALPKVVCVGAGKCVACKAMEPVRAALRKDYAGRLLVEYHDITQEEAALDVFRVRVIPTTILLDGSGKELDRFEGFISKDDILKQFKQHDVAL